MWQRFTKRARQLVFYAVEEAQQRGAEDVSSEHLLLGLIRDSESTAALALDRMGFTIKSIRSAVETKLQSKQAHAKIDMVLTPIAKRVLDLAYDEVKRLKNDYVGTEHILLGLILASKGIAGRVLIEIGVDISKTRETVEELQAELGTSLPG